MLTKIVTPPAAEPLSLIEVKKHLRLAVLDADANAYTAEDDKINGLIKAAREVAEVHTRRALITQTWDAALEGFPNSIDIQLPYAPLQSVTSVSYTNAAGVAATFTDYTVDLFSNLIRLKYGYSWPDFYPQSLVTVRYLCGYGAAGSAVPASIKQAMLLIVGHLHANTEATVTVRGADVIDLPLGVDALLSGYRRMEF